MQFATTNLGSVPVVCPLRRISSAVLFYPQGSQHQKLGRGARGGNVVIRRYPMAVIGQWLSGPSIKGQSVTPETTSRAKAPLYLLVEGPSLGWASLPCCETRHAEIVAAKKIAMRAEVTICRSYYAHDGVYDAGLRESADTSS